MKEGTKMLCQNCNKNSATIHYKSNLNGNTAEKYLCSECAEKMGLSKTAAFQPIDLIDGFLGSGSDDIFGSLLAGMMNDNNVKTINEPRVCTKCGMRFSDFLHGGKIGCADCYKTFSSSLGSTIKRLHGKSTHCGKMPEGFAGQNQNKKKIEELRSKLANAIEKQEYEMAAKYRDEIKALENSEKEGA